MTFEDARPFSQGLAAVQSGGRWGYIDLTGKFVIAREVVRVSEPEGLFLRLNTPQPLRGSPPCRGAKRQ